MNVANDDFDVTLVGGGPAGLFGAFYGGLRGMKVKVIDSLDQVGGQLITLYPEKLIYDVAGFPAVLAKTLVRELVRQAERYKPVFAVNERVEQLVRRDDGGFELVTDKGRHRTRTVVITAGAGAFTPKKLPGVRCEVYEGRGLAYFVRDMSPWRDQRVLIVGGGDSAVDWALNLLPIAGPITLIHRANSFRAHEDSVARLRESRVAVRMFYELKEIHGQERVEGATIYDNRSHAEERLDVDRILINIGFSSTLGPIREWGLALDREGIVVNSRMETSVPGVYAAGDVASYPGKLKLIATGFGEAATAVNHAKNFLDPKSKSFPGHSSALVPKQEGEREQGETGFAGEGV